MLAKKKKILSGLDEDRKLYGFVRIPYQYTFGVLKNFSIYS